MAAMKQADHSMALPFQTTLRWATEADFDALGEVMFAALGFVARRREQVTVGGEVLDRFEMEMIL